MKTLFFALLFSTNALASGFAPSATEIFTLSSDKSSYSAGETAILRGALHTKPTSPNLEFDLVATLNGSPIAVDRLTDFQMFSTVTNLGAGSYIWSVQLVIQDSRMAESLKESVATYGAEILDIQKRLETETNPDIIANLQARLVKVQHLLAAAEAELGDIRSPVGAPKSILFQVQ